MSLANNYPSTRPTLLLDFARAKTLDPRITFTRASTGVYYDGDTDAVAEQNLQTQSQALNEAASWTFTSTGASNNVGIAPDGTSTAELLIEGVSNSVHWVFTADGVLTTVAGAYTFSVFLKKGTGATAPNIIQLTFRGATAGGTQYANFDISVGGGTSGTVTASADLTSSSITAVGNGWYRCSITRTLTAGSNSGGAIAFTNNNPTATRGPAYVGVTTSDVLVWGAQLEQRSAVTAYTATTTQAITNYIPVLLTAASGVPRFDHNPTTDASLGLLIEEQRTNLLTYSDDFSNAAWVKVRSNITSNTIVAPDGTLTGDKFFEDTTASNTHQIQQAVTIVANTTYTTTLYAKAAERSEIRLLIGAGSDGINALYNLATVTATAQANTGSGVISSATITPVGNGWFRISASGIISPTSTSCIVTLRLIAAGSNSYTGDGYSGVFIWGAQLEAGAFPTSYIATVASQVTRSADSASMTGTNFSSWFNNAEGTLFFEGTFNYQSPAAGFPRMTALVGSNPNTDDIGIYTRSIGVGALSGQTFFIIRENSNAPVDISPSSQTILGSTKAAFAYKTNDVAATCFGLPVTTDTTANLPVCQALQIFGAAGFQSQTTGRASKIAYYPLRLPNNQLIALTGS